MALTIAHSPGHAWSSGFTFILAAVTSIIAIIESSIARAQDKWVMTRRIRFPGLAETNCPSCGRYFSRSGC